LQCSDTPTPEEKEFGYLILKSFQVINKEDSLISGKNEHISECCVEVNALENEADQVCREIICRLFDNENDPIQLLKWKEIYETEEESTTSART
jgi:uncharacterized protein Yka (UPF0111/DUF47 family)